ncbi:MAG: EAL domain-containing protein [Oleiphilaceae bacterium]|nr:EAL domain-containing protein [Oleiphilaceae bacterium]
MPLEHAQEQGTRSFVPARRLMPFMSALLGLGLIAILFTVLVIQLLSGVTGYLGGESIWSRAQVETVRLLTLYSDTGKGQYLRRAEAWYEVPIADMNARRAMEEGDYEAAAQFFLQGRNHPDDIPRMIWLYRLLNDAPYFAEAIKAWKESDQGLLALGHLMERVAQAEARVPKAEDSQDLQFELEQLDRALAENAKQFRQAMTGASRALVDLLSITTIVFFLMLGAMALILIMRFTRALRESEYNFRLTFEHAGLGIAQLDEKGHFLEVNAALCKLLGYSRAQLLNLRYQQIIYEADKDVEIEGRLAVGRGERDHISLTQRLICGDGTITYTRITVSLLGRVGNGGLRFIGLVEDVSEAHRLNQELNYQARHDDLTGLINRRAFEHYLEEALVKARSENFVHALCFIDLDQFKIINDTMGHFVGDQLLKQVAQTLSKCLRKSDLLARLGGDEFAVIFDCCEPERALELADELRCALENMPFVWDDRSFSIGCSIGIVPITASSGDLADLLRAADSACHLAKEQGRNRVLLSHEKDEEIEARRAQMEWLERIRQAIDQDRLFLDAQRIHSLDLEPGYRYEVLVRMRGEDGTVVPPGAFLPAAERFGIVHLIDRWVIEQVCRLFADYDDHLDKVDACHINISGRSFDHEDFAEYVNGLLAQYQISAEKICFEITETAAISKMSEVRRFMASLREAGAQFALDDFGAGLSSFSYLKQLPVDLLKIDGSFVRNIARDETDRAMVRAINDIGQTLGKRIVAEFVEDEEALAHLQDMGVQYAQGFHLHRPESFEKLLKNKRNAPGQGAFIANDLQ